MSNDSSNTLDLMEELEGLAAKLGNPWPHVIIERFAGGWELSVFIRPIDHPDVCIGQSPEGPHGYIDVEALEACDALSAAVRICKSVADTEAVAS